MEYPFIFIESKITERKEFDVTDGYQPTYALFFMKSGSFSLKINKKKVLIRDGDCVIFPENINFYRHVIEPIVFTYIKFKINEKSPFSLNLPCGKIDIKDKKRFLSSMNSYDKLSESTDSLAVFYKKHLLYDVLLQICDEHNLLNSENNINFLINNCNDKLVNKATEYISNNISEKIKIENICKFIGTNASTLNFKFRREFNCSIGEFITASKIKLARKLLVSTTYSVTQIAEKCGYENVYYFSTAFKKENNISPSKYRKSHSV